MKLRHWGRRAVCGGREEECRPLTLNLQPASRLTSSDSWVTNVKLHQSNQVHSNPTVSPLCVPVKAQRDTDIWHLCSGLSHRLQQRQSWAMTLHWWTVLEDIYTIVSGWMDMCVYRSEIILQPASDYFHFIIVITFTHVEKHLGGNSSIFLIWKEITDMGKRFM